MGGEYVRHYQRGKHVLEQLGGKTMVMTLLGHADPNVRYEALLAVQKLMVHNWSTWASRWTGRQPPPTRSAWLWLRINLNRSDLSFIYVFSLDLEIENFYLFILYIAFINDLLNFRDRSLSQSNKCDES